MIGKILFPIRIITGVQGFPRKLVLSRDVLWKPMILRESGSFLRELYERITRYSAYINSNSVNESVLFSENIGKKILNGQIKSRLNPTEICRLAGIEERKYFFALTGLLTQKELESDNFNKKIELVLSLSLQP